MKLSKKLRIIKNFFLARYFGIPKPVVLDFMITTRCNFNCDYCNMPVNKDYPFKRFKRFVDKNKKDCGFIIIGGGEPLIHPEFKEYADYLKNISVHTSIITNGSLISRNIDNLKKFDNVYVSLDGLDDVHNRSRSSAEEIIDQIRIAINNGISINLIIVMTRYNINHLPDLFKKAEELNISSVSVLPLHNGTYRDDLQNLAPSKEEVKKNLLYIKKEYSSLLKYKDSIDFFIKNYPDNYYKKKCKISRFYFAFDFDHNLQKCVTLKKIGDNRSITKPISCNRCVNCNNLDFQNIISTIRFGLSHIK